MQAVILAAGRGTRLKPISDRYSKAMVPVLGRPLADRVLETLVVNGVHDVVMVIGEEDLEIRDHFTTKTTLDITARFVVQEKRLGMAHALGLAAGLIHGPFVLSACDSIKDVEHVGELLREAAAADGALSLLDVPWNLVSKSAPVELDGKFVRRIVEKPPVRDAPSNTVSLPLYALPHELLDALKDLELSARGEYELQGAIQAVIDAGAKIVGVRAKERHQVSTPQELLEMSLRLLRSGQEPPLLAPRSVGAGTTLVEPLRIDRDVVIGRDCLIGPNVSLERGCQVGDGVVITNAVVLPEADVRSGESISNQVFTR